MRFGYLVLICLMLAGCVNGIPDAGPPPPRTEACQIWVSHDGGPWKCYSRERVLRDMRRELPTD